MVARYVFSHRLRQVPPLNNPGRLRYVSSSRTPLKQAQPKPQPPSPAYPSSLEKVSQRQENWLTQRVRQSPIALKIFIGLARVLGYGSPRQLAARRALALYRELCVRRADEEREFWLKECHLPPTFQSWFTITNLHIWLLTVRLRALPPPHGHHYIQGLLDHFFMDVEDRIRAILQPGVVPIDPLRPLVTFYPEPVPLGPNADKAAKKKERRGRAPERLLVQQMKIFKEQWAGMGMSFDLALVKGDMEMAGAIWRNFLGARGAGGFVPPSLPDLSSASSSTSSIPSSEEPYFRRSINYVGGEIESVKKLDKRGLEREEARNDFSGVHDHPPALSHLYVRYPETMVCLTEYLRRELVRLEQMPDSRLLGSGIGQEWAGVGGLGFGPIRGRLPVSVAGKAKAK